MKTTLDDNQTPSDSPLKLTRDDLRNLSEACDDAIAAWKLNKEQWQDYMPGEYESVDTERANADAYIEAYTELKARLTEELKHCERCRKIAPLSLCDARHYYCEVCSDELEPLETGADYPHGGG